MTMKKSAFTLIELLVVIAIIAILAAILFPVFAQAKVAAKGAADLSNVKQLALATVMYSGDNDDYFPTAFGTDCSNQWDADSRIAEPAFADGHAKNRPMATGDQLLDPWPIAGYDSNGVPDNAPGFEGHEAVWDQYCQVPLFRPDITHNP
jgi:prepilin-type N-terminal cleavage/methylation domain-containing protein